MLRATAVVTGKVQGVGYRQFVSDHAHRLGLHGSVQNMPDGSVHIIAEGSLAALEEFTRIMWARGMPEIRVDGCAGYTGGSHRGVQGILGEVVTGKQHASYY